MSSTERDERRRGRGHSTGGESPDDTGSPSDTTPSGVCSGKPDTERPRLRDPFTCECEWCKCGWKSDMNPNRLRGDSAPSRLGGLDESGRLTGLAGVDGVPVEGLSARGEPRALNGGEEGRGLFDGKPWRSGVLMDITAS